MNNIKNEIKNAPNVQLLTTLYSFQGSKSKAKQATYKFVEKELKARGVII